MSFFLGVQGLVWGVQGLGFEFEGLERIESQNTCILNQ